MESATVNAAPARRKCKLGKLKAEISARNQFKPSMNKIRLSQLLAITIANGGQ